MDLIMHLIFIKLMILTAEKNYGFHEKLGKHTLKFVKFLFKNYSFQDKNFENCSRFSFEIVLFNIFLEFSSTS